MWRELVESISGIENNLTHTRLAAAHAGAGIAVLPHFVLVAREDDELIAVSNNVADHDVWLITHPEFRRDPKVRATADLLKRIAAGPSGLR